MSPPLPTLRYLYVGRAEDGHEGFVVRNEPIPTLATAPTQAPCACGAPLLLDPQWTSRTTEYTSRCGRGFLRAQAPREP